MPPNEIASISLTGTASPVAASPGSAALFPPIVSRELDNGLQALIAPDFTAPVVSIQYWCATGSIHEGKWLGAGISHLLEHLLFKGTPTRGNSAMAQEIQDLGGHLNAYTSFERTVYHVDLPAANWRQALAILTDSVQHSVIPEPEFEPEKEVIRREFAMGDDNPDSVMTKLAFRTAFTTHPYRFPVIGHLDLFNRVTRDDVLAYYRERYAPQNLTLVVCGAVDGAAVADEAARLWADEPRRFLPDVLVPSEPPQQSPRSVEKAFPTDIARLALLHPIPGLHHADIPAVQILSIILGGGRSSLLHQLLVEKEGLAEEVDAFAYAPPGIGLFGVDARCRPENRGRVVDRLREELGKFRASAPAELERAKRLCVTQQVHQFKTMAGKAGAIGGGWLAARDPLFSQTFLQRLQAVTLDDVAAVAARYLTPANESRVELIPESAAAAVTVSDAAAPDAVPVPDLVPSLPVRALYLRDERLPLFTFRATLPGGLLHEPEGKAGLGRLASQLLLKGTKTRSAERIAREAEQLGGHLSSDAGNNSAALHLELLSQDWEAGLDLFLDVLANTEFDGKELETEKRKHLASIALEQDQPMALARDLVRGALYPGHPYSRNALGTAESVSALTRADVLGYVARVFRSRGLVLSATGPVGPAQWSAAVAKALSGFAPADAASLAVPQAAAALSGIVRAEKSTPKEQAVLQIAYPTVPLSHPDQLPLLALVESLSDLGTRLFVRIREQLGLAYFVSATRFQGQAAGYFCFFAGTDPKKKTLVEAAMFDEIGKLAQDGLTSAELERARAKLLSEEQLDSQNPSSVAAGSAADELLGLGHAYAEERRRRLRALTLDEVNAAAARYLGRQECVVAVVSPE